MRQVVLDTETTGLDPKQGHRIIEIGCVELENRRLTGNKLHMYLQPDREIDDGAIEVHQITNEFLADKPRFGDVVDEFLDFVKGSELVIHNAAFDVGFIDSELNLLDRNLGQTKDYCGVLDTLAMARKMHPGKRNDLDSLCKRYDINNSHRTLHGALLDAEILADVYLMMTGGQVSLGFDAKQKQEADAEQGGAHRISQDRAPLQVITASPEEQERHEKLLANLRGKDGDQPCLWDQLKH
ncbi:DNA polymerase III, epsilon subunit [gamma proteobacterium HTCC5015]|nr:DNA polymerase III, epsilon subunit [gamma proteobacterium HTCC5015]